ncbi:MerR family DNA-binding transcriptional regulator [Paenibacillus ginsengarvi]|uniref:MerR family DNA-binding transcriptional regulator n=1 Tax=Paenibacillus ginsengarvi TaxID=400777 RepID=A0A3B0BZ27_9BACL|nr:MerR family DNA-binding transcriptional regulator [Paenibacillus ginsengarvi]RKN78282.1 MerR family DNA-binding transcriptional regulator [Paenibacillus ginsengarvi]
MSRLLRPADIAKQLGISTSSLRNYEARGLVPPAKRAPNGYREYTSEHPVYFECIVAMSPGFGMEITSSVLSLLQRRELGEALWLLNDAQTAMHEDRKMLDEAEGLLIQIKEEKTRERTRKNIGEMARATKLSASTLRYWEKEGYIQSARTNETNRYRQYDLFQEVKIWLLKSTQNAVYSSDVVLLKQAIAKLSEGDLHTLQALIETARGALVQRNREQLGGLHRLYQLCTELKLI